MATRPKSIEKQVEKQLGKEAASAMFAKIDSMVREGKSADAIERAVFSDLRLNVEERVTSAITVRLPRITRITGGAPPKPFGGVVKRATSPISMAPKITHYITATVKRS